MGVSHPVLVANPPDMGAPRPGWGAILRVGAVTRRDGDAGGGGPPAHAPAPPP